MDRHPSPRVARDAPRLIRDVIAAPGAIRIVTQPILDLVDGRIAGYEALSRFDRRIGWTPQHWFQCAQRCGLGARLEAAAIDAALSVPFRPPATVLTVNVSPSTLGTRALGEVLPGDLSGLMFELTQNEPIAGDPTLPATLQQLRWLHRAGVTQAQGYLLGRPQPGWANNTLSRDDTIRQATTPGLLEQFDLSRQRASTSGQRSRWTEATHAPVRRLRPTVP